MLESRVTHIRPVKANLAVLLATTDAIDVFSPNSRFQIDLFELLLLSVQFVRII